MVKVVVKTEVEFEPWLSPNFARQGENAVAVRDLPDGALGALASAWLDALYTKAEKPNPFKRIAFRG